MALFAVFLSLDYHVIWGDGGMNVSNWRGYSAQTMVLPFIEQQNLFNQFKFNDQHYRTDIGTPPPMIVGRNVVPAFLCPSDIQESVSQGFGVGQLGPTNYASCTGSGAGGGTPFRDEGADGMFYVNSATEISEVLDQ